MERKARETGGRRGKNKNYNACGWENKGSQENKVIVTRVAFVLRCGSVRVMSVSECGCNGDEMDEKK